MLDPKWSPSNGNTTNDLPCQTQNGVLQMATLPKMMWLILNYTIINIKPPFIKPHHVLFILNNKRIINEDLFNIGSTPLKSQTIFTKATMLINRTYSFRHVNTVNGMISYFGPITTLTSLYSMPTFSPCSSCSCSLCFSSSLSILLSPSLHWRSYTKKLWSTPKYSNKYRKHTQPIYDVNEEEVE